MWYKPDLSLHSDMIVMFGKKKMIETAEQLFSEIEKEGIKPDTRAYTEMIGAFLRVGMVEKAMDLYKSMKEEGCNPDKLTLVILIRNLEKAGAQDLACSVRRDCEKYIDEPEKFLSEVYTKFVSIASIYDPGFVKSCYFCLIVIFCVMVNRFLVSIDHRRNSYMLGLNTQFIAIFDRNVHFISILSEYSI